MPFISKLLAINIVEATKITSFAYIGVAASSPIIGWFALRFGYLKVMALGSWNVFVLLSVLVLLPDHSIFSVYAIMFLLGVFCSTYQLSYSFSAKVIDDQCYQFTVMGFTNLCTMISAPILQPLIGMLASWKREKEVFDGFEVYSLSDYRFGLTLLLFILLIGSLLSTYLMLSKKEHFMQS